MTTGTIDFITSSGRMTPIDAIPTPDLAVPYAAPKPDSDVKVFLSKGFFQREGVLEGREGGREREREGEREKERDVRRGEEFRSWWSGLR
jgi:hypothetical protein